MYIYAFLYSQDMIPKNNTEDLNKLMHFVHWKIYDEEVENKTDYEVIEKARLLALIRRNITFKFFYNNNIWNKYERWKWFELCVFVKQMLFNINAVICNLLWTD